MLTFIMTLAVDVITFKSFPIFLNKKRVRLGNQNTEQ